jgi:hypothetical protein
LKKFFPSLKRKSCIDTFRLSQTLLHYVPSYALEVLIELLGSKPDFQDILKKVQPYITEEENFHDAYYDSKLTIALFWYLIKRVELLASKYPVLHDIISQSEGAFSEVLLKDKKILPIRLEFPSLKKISPSNTQMITGNYQIILDEKEK